MIADNPTWTVAERIKRARLLAGLDQADVSAACSVSRTAVSAWENGQTEPRFSSLVLLARLTGQPLEWFAAGVNDEAPAADATGAGGSRLRESNPRPIHYE